MKMFSKCEGKVARPVLPNEEKVSTHNNESLNSMLKSFRDMHATFVQIRCGVIKTNIYDMSIFFPTLFLVSFQLWFPNFFQCNAFEKPYSTRHTPDKIAC